MEKEKIFDPRSVYGWVTERKTMQLLLRGFIDETQPKKILSVVYQETGTDSWNSEKFFEYQFDGLEERFWSPRVFKPQKKPWQKFDDWIFDDDLTIAPDKKDDYELFIAKGEKWWDKVSDDSQFDLILGMFPTGGDNHFSNFEENFSFNQIFNTSLQYLSKFGLAFFTVNLEFITNYTKQIHERLRSQELYISAVFEPAELFGDAHFSLDLSSEGDRYSQTFLPKTLIIAIGRKPVEFIFAAQFCSNNQILNLAKNYKSLQSNNRLSEQQDNLCKGIKKYKEHFYNFNHHRTNIKIENLKSDYKEFDAVKLRDITVDIYLLMPPSNHREDILSIDDFNNYLNGPPAFSDAKSREKRKKQLSNSLFICANREKLTDVLLLQSFLKYFSRFSDWDLDQGLLHYTMPYFYQIVVDEEIVDREFLAIYLSQPEGLGKLTLDSIAEYAESGLNTETYINQTDLENIPIPLPDMKTQKNLAKTANKIAELGGNISQFKTNLSLKPVDYQEINDKADEMNKIFHSFSEIDKINSLISNVNETDKTEFKASFHYDDSSKKKSYYNQERALKSICGFLNRDGGTLLIGVSERDKKRPPTINGIDEEIKKLHHGRYDEFVRYFSQTIEKKLSMGREECWDYIKHDKHVINDKSVLKVDCQFHDKGPVKLKGKEDVLYVRRYAEVKAYKDNEMDNYMIEHWKNS